jgi:hypothetical protein
LRIDLLAEVGGLSVDGDPAGPDHILGPAARGQPGMGDQAL